MGWCGASLSLRGGGFQAAATPMIFSRPRHTGTLFGFDARHRASLFAELIPMIDLIISDHFHFFREDDHTISLSYAFLQNFFLEFDDMTYFHAQEAAAPWFRDAFSLLMTHLSIENAATFRFRDRLAFLMCLYLCAASAAAASHTAAWRRAFVTHYYWCAFRCAW